MALPRQRGIDGRFLTTTNSTRYKAVQFNGKRMSEHNRVFCLALNIPYIPKGFVVHHLDENKSNNHPDNLALITITAHNRIHAHEAWNKGISANVNEKWAETVKKQEEQRRKTYLNKCKETYDLSLKGLSHKEIAEKLNIKEKKTVYLQIKRYKEFIINQKTYGN